LADLQRLEASKAQPAPAPAPVAAVVAEPAPPVGRSVPAGAGVTFAVGAATLIVGAVFGVLTTLRLRDYQSEPDGNLAFMDHEQAKSFALPANICFGAGGAIALAGALWGLIGWLRSGS
jgi:hypothetical protein